MGPEDEQADDDTMMDHIALEMMHAVDSKDHGAFRDGFKVLVAHTLKGMSVPESED